MAEHATAVVRLKDVSSAQVAAHSAGLSYTFNYAEADILARSDLQVTREQLKSCFSGPQSSTMTSTLDAENWPTQTDTAYTTGYDTTRVIPHEPPVGEHLNLLRNPTETTATTVSLAFFLLSLGHDLTQSTLALASPMVTVT
ncbi:unnamed protein product [Dibothriocephalus latus]|uniref:Uncharacterized protein n=1 Tax=Dibothriocephalus latus TaxID=60516 RepID=A0A3P7LS94_DIBLA|nr:unnamed protein product [Dibothriocephalus latus]